MKATDATYYKEIGTWLAFHSVYKGFRIYRQYSPVADRFMMSYYAIKWKDPENIWFGSRYEVMIHAKNLASIKAAVSEAKL